MAHPVSPIPDGYHTVNIFLIVPNAKQALEFYGKAFGAETRMRMPGPDDSTMHAEMKIGDSCIMLTDENPAWDAKSPQTLGGSPASVHLYVPDADALFARALAAGCTVAYPMENAFWGDRYGKVKDPYGFTWGIATHVEEVSAEECERRAGAWMAKHAAGGQG